MTLTIISFCIDIPAEPAQFAGAEVEVIQGQLCVTCKFNPTPVVLAQNCTAIISNNMTSDLKTLRIAWGQFVHGFVTECLENKLNTGLYTLRVFGEWDAQCSQNYPIINLEVNVSLSHSNSSDSHGKYLYM